MNEHLTVNAHGLRLLQQFEGAPRLKARLCEGGRYELSYGVTFYPDGTPVLENDTCTSDEAQLMFIHALGHFEAIVRKLVTVTLSSNQFSACTIFVYNIGEQQFASSSVLRCINANRMDDAADAFGMWLYATRDGHKQALRGLLRRQYATACLFMSYGWEVACADDAIALVREKPPNNKGTDKVLSKTLFKDVLAVAQRYPLEATPEPSITLIIDKPPGIEDPLKPELILVDQLPQPSTEVKAEVGAGISESRPSPVAPEPASESVASPKDGSSSVVTATTGEIEVVSGQPEVAKAPQVGSSATSPAPLPKPPEPAPSTAQQQAGVNASQTSGIDWSNAKAMILSRRFWGLSLAVYGRLHMMWFGSTKVLGVASDPIAQEMFSGLVVMIIGEGLQMWGDAKAKRPLK